MVPAGEADFLLVLEPTQVEVNRPVLKPGGVLITTDVIPEGTLKNKKSLNVAMLGAPFRSAGYPRGSLAGCHPRPPGHEAAPAQRRSLRQRANAAGDFPPPFPKRGRFVAQSITAQPPFDSNLRDLTDPIMLKELWNDAAGGFHPVSAPDFLPEQQLREVQLRRLKAVVARAYDKVPLFRQRLEKRGLTPDSIHSLADIAKLPFTVKTDLRDTYPFGLFASPMADVVRLHASSGTTGKPIVVAYTREDVEVWSEVMTRTFAACGLHRGDIVQNAFGYGLFTGGLGAHYGAETLGATVIPISGGNTDRQIMVLRDFGVTAICATPSYFMHLAEKAQEMGIDLKEMPLRVGVFGAEPWSDAMRARIEADTGIRAFDIYGLSEIIGPGVASECGQHEGLHVFEDHFYPEIIDPETGEPLPDGEEGELVLTTLSKKAMPMIRYRTRDITAILPERCGCGRTLRRILRIGRRSDDMFIIRGVNVYPSQVEAALLNVEGTLPHYQIILTREQGLDQMTVEVEVTPEVFSDKVRALEEVRARLAHAIENILGIRVGLRLVGPHTIQRSEGKARRVIDKRNG
jgi:phenylacetate-CoA ligase